MSYKYTNQLSEETSPYLLQHAHNPVNWQAWNETSLQKAITENKPIILSIGYSACHWCHVMEHESFENEAVAKIMNEYFICIKVDREERPDVDGIYMDAIQAMGIHGGWPLNVFLMPDKKPFYGGTYFRPNQWASICQNIAEAFLNNRSELQNSANGFAQNLQTSEVEKYGVSLSENTLQYADFELIVSKLIDNSDPIWGGVNKAPKFPMPSIYLFLLDFVTGIKSKNEIVISAESHLQTTLNRMAMGGIFDQIGGGFSRYSVDGEWFCPHFEKMLYDNAQLLTLYSKAYLWNKSELYKETITNTISWLKREVLMLEGGFYSAQDADSEGVEGKFYIWSKSEIDTILGEKAIEFCKVFQITEVGNWEHGQNILWKNEPILNSKFKSELELLLKFRNKRIFPGLDDKILCSWNGLVINGLVSSYIAVGDNSYLEMAINCGEFIKRNFYKNGRLNRTYKNGESKIEGFLEDYAAIISAFIELYKVTFDENWLSLAESLALTCFKDFLSDEKLFFNFSNNISKELIANKIELFDNVIPASNSIMAHNLYDLGVLLSTNDFINHSIAMVSAMNLLITRNGEYLSNWAAIAQKQSKSKIEIVIYGLECFEFGKIFFSQISSNAYVLGAEKVSTLPLFESRQPPTGKTYIYVCINNACKLPVQSVEEAISLFKLDL